MTTRPGRGQVLAVAAGALVGTWLRASLASAWPHPVGAWPWATFVVNVVGAFALGALVAVLERGLAGAWRQHVHAAVGVGLLGSFTTYSAFAMEIVTAARAGWVGLGVTYAVVSIGAGLAAAWCGLRLGGWKASTP